jgi:hypothetical protein
MSGSEVPGVFVVSVGWIWAAGIWLTSSFELDRCQHAERRMPTLAMVPDLEVLEDGGGQLDAGLPPSCVHYSSACIRLKTTRSRHCHTKHQLSRHTKHQLSPSTEAEPKRWLVGRTPMRWTSVCCRRWPRVGSSSLMSAYSTSERRSPCTALRPDFPDGRRQCCRTGSWGWSRQSPCLQQARRSTICRGSRESIAAQSAFSSVVAPAAIEIRSASLRSCGRGPRAGASPTEAGPGSR